MKRRVVATDTYSTQHSPPTCNRPMTQVERDGDFTTRKLNTRGEGSTPSAFSSQEGNCAPFDTNDGDRVFFVLACFLFLAARQGQRGGRITILEKVVLLLAGILAFLKAGQVLPHCRCISIASRALLQRTSKYHFPC